MQTPKEKAEELVRLFMPLCKDVKHIGIINGLATVMNDDLLNHMAAKQCALIDIKNSIKLLNDIFNEFIEDCSFPQSKKISGKLDELNEVKKELEFL